MDERAMWRVISLVVLIGIAAAAAGAVNEYAGGSAPPYVPTQAALKLHPPALAPFQTRFQSVVGRACTPVTVPACTGYLIRHASGQCPSQPTCCGNKQCEAGENAANCPRDCSITIKPKAGCPAVPPVSCPGRLVYALEPKGACPHPPTCCGDGKCESTEGERTCQEDCAKKVERTQRVYCPEIALPRCTGFLVYPTVGRRECTKPPTCCGDRSCSGAETSLNCPGDCGPGQVNGRSNPFRQRAVSTYREAATKGTILGTGPQIYYRNESPFSK